MSFQWKLPTKTALIDERAQELRPQAKRTLLIPGGAPGALLEPLHLAAVHTVNAPAQPDTAKRFLWTNPTKFTQFAVDVGKRMDASFSGGLDAGRMPAKGTSKFKVRAVSSQDIEMCKGLVNSATPGAEATLSNWRKFSEWRTVNLTVKSLGMAIALFVSQAAATLSPGTASNMATMLVDHARSCGSAIVDMPLLNHVIEGLDLKYAQQGAKHALDITDEEAAGFLPRIGRVDVRAVVWLLLTCGARLADLMRLEGMQMKIHDDRLEIEFRVTKANRTVADKRHVSFPFFHAIDKEVRDFLNKPHVIPVCDTVNRVLKAAKLKIVDGRSITTYSFRRLFDQRVISWYTDADGCTDWLKVITWSGHKDAKIVASTYAKCKVLSVPAKRTADVPTESNISGGSIETIAPTTVSDPLQHEAQASSERHAKRLTPNFKALSKMFKV